MSSISIFIALLTLSLAMPLPVHAQSSTDTLSNEQFSVRFEIGPRGQATNISFESSGGEQYRARFTESAYRKYKPPFR